MLVHSFLCELNKSSRFFNVTISFNSFVAISSLKSIVVKYVNCFAASPANNFITFCESKFSVISVKSRTAC